VKIPSDSFARDIFYDDLIAKCTSSQADRQQFYDFLRAFYLFGTDGSVVAPFNKIFPHIDLLASFLYSSETTKFMTQLGVSAKEVEHRRVSSLNKGVNDIWLSSNTDRIVSYATTWGLVYGSEIVKCGFVVNETTKTLTLQPASVHPGSMGVLREDVPYIDQQEAITHSYYITKSQLENELKDHPEKEKILANASTTTGTTDEQPSGVARLIMGAMNPMGGNVNGSVEMGSGVNMDYIADIAEEMIQMVELWVWDDDLNDYRTVTKIKDGATVYDRKNIFLPGEQPFVFISPNPLPFYIWGMSEVAGLIPLQAWRNKRLDEIQKLLSLQVKPPTAASGYGILEEKMYGMFSEGGLLSPMDGVGMNGKVERFKPDISPDIYAIIHEIDQSFNEHSGLPNTLQGKGDTQVRSGKQASELSRLGSARIKRRSLVEEDSLEHIATAYLKLMQRYDTTVYTDESGVAFTAEQFTEDYTVKVDAHSNSPIFIEDKKELAFELFNLKIISAERVLEMIDAPDKEIMKRELKEIQAQQSAAHKEAEAFELKKDAAKHGNTPAEPQQPAAPSKKPSLMDRFAGK
jgi:hypothetical protein